MLQLQTVAVLESRRRGRGVAALNFLTCTKEFLKSTMALKQFWWPWCSVEPTGTLVQCRKKPNTPKTFKAETFSTEDPLLTFDLLKRTLVDINYQIITSGSLAVPAADVPASIVPATVTLALKGVQTLLSALPMQRSTPTARIMSHGGASLTWRERCTSGPTAVPFEWGDSTSSRGSHTVLEMDAGRVWQTVPRSALPEQIKISLLEQDGILESRNLLATSFWQWHRC